MKTTFVPQLDSSWEISGRCGKLFVATRPEMGIDRFRVRWQGQNLFVNKAAIELEGKARASFSGSIALNDSADLDLDLILNRTGARDSDRDLDLALDLARARIRDSDRTFVIARVNLSTLRIVCCISIFFSMIKDNSSNTKLAWFKRLWPKQIKTDFDSYIEEQRRDAALNLYAFFFLIEERRKGNLPAWEGIRIVRERIE